MPTCRKPLLAVDRLAIHIQTRTRTTSPIHDISVRVDPGERLGLVGESGSGKSMTASAVLGLLPPGARITGGTIRLDDADITHLAPERLRRLRGKTMALIPQDPLSSLNPVLRIGAQLTEALTAHERLTRRAATARAVELLTMVGLPEAGRRLAAYPHEFSGGMRQRLLIAMALALRPRLLIADESTTALDVTVQAQVLDLIDQLARETNAAVILITHDLAVAAGRTDSLVVLRHGRTVATGPTSALLTAPSDAYTRALLDASPRFSRPRKSRFLTQSGTGATS
ncbi:ABC transporter ATP-binding protein [Spirillospora sp. CA-255316]